MERVVFALVPRKGAFRKVLSSKCVVALLLNTDTHSLLEQHDVCSFAKVVTRSPATGFCALTSFAVLWRRGFFRT